jgi:hypothetical protein
MLLNMTGGTGGVENDVDVVATVLFGDVGPNVVRMPGLDDPGNVRLNKLDVLRELLRELLLVPLTGAPEDVLAPLSVD